LQIFPTNIFKAMAEGQILPVIFFAILVGIGLSVLKEQDDKKAGAEMFLIYWIPLLKLYIRLLNGLWSMHPLVCLL